jgi:2-amino-4-hydroxy-6-hydroxymethyldihydropteridine diphosphokinase
MKHHQVYIGMGGNIGDSVHILNLALKEISLLKHIRHLRCSHFYHTSPVSTIIQNDYVNAVCALETKLSPHELSTQLCAIETKLGKVPKPKDHPRILDLDILLYGNEIVREGDLEIPHPRWEERLFVLIPMKELVDVVVLSDPVGPGGVRRIELDEVIRNFDNVHNEQLVILAQPEE